MNGAAERAPMGLVPSKKSTRTISVSGSIATAWTLIVAPSWTVMPELGLTILTKGGCPLPKAEPVTSEFRSSSPILSSPEALVPVFDPESPAQAGMTSSAARMMNIRRGPRPIKRLLPASYLLGAQGLAAVMGASLQDQHRVAVAEEAVLLADRFRV